MARSDERKFVTFQRGEVRDNVILLRFRNVLRTKVNPDTNRLFTEAEIAYITQEDSRFFVEADAIDLFGQAIQQRALWFADQVQPDRAATDYLMNYHGALWLPDGKLDATGGSGKVTATGTAGTIYVGSTTVGDPTATILRDPNGKQYQVAITDQIGIGTTEVILNVIGIDTGTLTNPPQGTELQWVNPPLGTDPTCLVLTDFAGGFDAESDADFAKRIINRIRSKPGAGNSAQFRIWAQAATVAVEDAFEYPCAFHTGSIMVVVIQKRGSTLGPLARVANFGTLAAVTNFLVAPSSPVVPDGIHVLVNPVQPQSVDIALGLAMPFGSSGGWHDINPWPTYSAAFPNGVRITAVTDSQHFAIQTDVAPVNGTSLSGANVPAMSIWNQALSQFETLDVASVTQGVGNNWNIVLNNAPTAPVSIGKYVSPKNERTDIIAQSLTDYFDSLGPGEAVASTDLRYYRAARFPRPDQEYPMRAGQGMIVQLSDNLGGALTDAALEYISQDTPSVPPSASSLVFGTFMLTLGGVGIYPLSQ